jgi:hypothetical protein
MRIFEKMIFWLVLLKLEISYYRVIITWRILVSFLEDFLKIIFFGWWNIWVSIILLFNAKWQGHSTVTHPVPLVCLVYVLSSCTFYATPKFQLRVAPDGRSDARTDERAGDRSAIASSSSSTVGGYILFTWVLFHNCRQEEASKQAI